MEEFKNRKEVKLNLVEENKMNPYQKISRILGVDEKTIADFEGKISATTGQKGIIDKIVLGNDRIIAETLGKINLDPSANAEEARGALQKAIFYHEKQFLNFMATLPGQNEFEKAAVLSRSLAKPGQGFFLKKNLIGEIFKKRPPQNLLKYLGYNSVDELLKEDGDLTEAFSALRFVETDAWMHQTFDEAYSNFTSNDFEEREVEIRVLGERWHDVARKFVEKKHHNVSHLKEFGVIFLNPIKMDIPGKFLRDFALLLHYFHEIEFYAQLFKKYSAEANFSERFKALLRGDVKESSEAEQSGQYLIVQRYLTKENPNDPRLLQPRVNPESIHWAKGEKDLAMISAQTGGQVDLGMWFNLDWVGGLFGEEIVSFDLEDNAMSLVSSMEGKHEHFSYHQREAMWTKIFAEYAGGEEKLEKLITDNFDKGFVIL